MGSTTHATSTGEPGIDFLMKKRRCRSALLPLVIMASASTVQAQDTTSELQRDIGQHVRHMYDALGIEKGLAVGVVKGNQLIFAEVYGARDVERGLPVLPDTPFYIASVTKSFLAAAVMRLVERGILDLDAPVSRYLPDMSFRSSELDARKITLRDLLRHTSRIENTPVDIRTYATGQQNSPRLQRLFAYSQAAYEGARRFQYTNIGYVLTGLIIEAATGQTWQEALEAEVFRPLDMRATGTSVSDRDPLTLAQPHRTRNGAVLKRRYLKTDSTMHAAGGIITTVPDLVPWLIMNMNGGMFEGRRILAPESMREMHAPQVYLDADFYGYHRFAYGLGWYSADFDGERLVHHFGGFEGFAAHVSFMPDHDVGVVILSNGRGWRTIGLVANYIYDRILGRPTGRYEASIEEWREDLATEAAPADATAEIRRSMGTTAPERYVGHYVNPLYGEINVIRDGDHLTATWGALNADAIPMGDDRFRVDWEVFESQLDFVIVDSNEVADGMIVRGVDGIEGNDVTFSREDP